VSKSKTASVLPAIVPANNLKAITLLASDKDLTTISLPIFPAILDIPEANPAKIFNPPITSEVLIVEFQSILDIDKLGSIQLVASSPAIFPTNPPANDAPSPKATYPIQAAPTAFDAALNAKPPSPAPVAHNAPDIAPPM